MTDELDKDDVYWVEGRAAAAPSAPAPAFDLDGALRSDRIEFWYQPKIDLRRKRLTGVEAFARFCAPDGRVVSAGELIEHASCASIVRLTERALVSALKTSLNFCEVGIDLRLAINVSVAALHKLPIVDIVREYRPLGGKSLGLIFDIPESEVLRYFDEIAQISSQLRRCGFSVAVDDFGASLLGAADRCEDWDSTVERTFEAIGRLRNVQFAELKLDRALVRNCGGDARHREICRHIIGLAHSFGSVAVGVGVERQAELKTLQDLQCDVGQGYLFGRPMSEERFLMLLWDRGVRARPKPQAA